MPLPSRSRTLPLADDDGPPIRHSGSLLRTIADAVPASIAYYEASSMCCRFANERYARSCGHTNQSVLGLTARQAMGEEVWSVIEPHVQRCTAGHTVRYIREHHLPSGQRQMLEVNLIPHQVQSDLLGIFVLMLDITHHWEAERAVRESQERMHKFAVATEEAIVFHQQGRITDGNEALERLIGYPLDTLMGTLIFDYISPEYRQSVIDYTQNAQEHPYEMELLHRSGRRVPVEVVGKTMPLAGHNYRIAVLRDISVRRQAQERAAFMALHDGLTQLPNRRYLLEQLHTTLTHLQHHHGNAALLYVNLDHFKTVNDSLGQQAGDSLLCAIARHLQEAVRASDFVARCGGDEFAVLLPEIGTQDEVLRVADHIHQAVNAVHTIAGTRIALSPSIGISLYPEHGTQGDALLRHAELAMQRAKDNGRAHYQVYDHSMTERAPLQELQLEQELRQALQEQTFVLHYQPQIRLCDGTVAGFEALVRWQHPARGLLGPDEFITFAESRGLIAPIGRWVLHEACRQMKAWHDAGLPRVPVAVNLSALELRQRDLLHDIQSVLQRTGLAPQYLEIELTESVLMQQASQAQSLLAALRALGVRISIDDFGTGYSSLAYLKRYPLDTLKIDRSFVADTPDSEDDVAIVTAIVQMGHSLQLSIIAEGVETLAQQTLLRQLGCDMAQGYSISRPLPAPRVPSWLQAHHAPGPESTTP